MNTLTRQCCFALLATAGLALSGCVAAKYKMAPKETPPATQLNIAAAKPPAEVVLNTAILYNGPGAWKQEAFWNEYVVSVTNHGDAPLTLEAATLVDGVDTRHLPGTDPWKLEDQSRKILKEYSAKPFLAVVGATTAWTAGSALAVGTAVAAGGIVAGGVASLAVLPVLPILAISSGVRTLVARNDVGEEFDRRRLLLPTTLAAGETKTGSLFFPVAPAPKSLRLRFPGEGAPYEVGFDLAPLANLNVQTAKSSTSDQARSEPQTVAQRVN